MPYDQDLADRIRLVLKSRRGISEKKMFGGLTFLFRGRMICGVAARELMVRVGPTAYEQALASPHVREMDLTGRPLRGLVFVGAKGVRGPTELKSWVERGIDFARGLPAK